MGIALISSNTTLPAFAKEQEHARSTVSVMTHAGVGLATHANIHAQIATQNPGNDDRDNGNNGASAYSPGHLKKLFNSNNEWQWQWRYENQNNNSNDNNDTDKNGAELHRINWNWQQCLSSSSAPCWNNMNNNATTTSIISSVSATQIATSSATITWSTNNFSNSSILYSTTSPVTSTSPAISSSIMTRYHSLTLQNLTPQTTYYFIVSSTNAVGNTATSSQYTFVTTPSTPITPVISSITVTNTSTTSVTLSWATNVQTTGTAWYSTSSPVTATSSTLNASSSILGTSHTVTLNSLTASTTYYGMITATDTGNNTTTSNEFSFTTREPVVITNFNATTTNATTANISWLTNYPATSNIWYSTSSPLVTTSTSTTYVSFPALVTNHLLSIPGLSPTSIYYFIVSSVDALGNIATSSQSSLTTQ